MKNYIYVRIKKALEVTLEMCDWLKIYEGQLLEQENINVLAEFQDFVIKLGEYLEKKYENPEKLIGILEKICEFVYQISIEGVDSDFLEKLLECVYTMNKILEKEPIEKTKILFLPYKASMWDSFESIYETAVKDEGVEVTVMPIPYYEKCDEKKILKNEAAMFKVNTVDYREFDMEKYCADIIYIHNPYDDKNKVTQLAKEFYSENIKRYTKLLVYVPYYISGMYKNEYRIIEKILLPGSQNSDIVICQSEIQKEIYKKYGVDSEKYIVLGNPKFDVLVNYIKNNKNEDIRKRMGLKNRKTILLNTSITYFLKKIKWISVYKNFFDKCSIKDINIIWRPHPLLEATVKSMRPELYEEFVDFCNEISKLENVYIDKLGTPVESMAVADGLISDYSSLIYQFYVTGKPIYSVDGAIKYRDEGILIFDYYDVYLKSQGMKIDEFVDMIIKGNDEKKHIRDEMNKKYEYLTDGCVGWRIYNEVLSRL